MTQLYSPFLWICEMFMEFGLYCSTASFSVSCSLCKEIRTGLKAGRSSLLL